MADYIRWLRALIGPALVPAVYATAIVRDAAGHILFQRRRDFGAAWWGLPGGLFEPGETGAACLQREVREETGLEVQPLRLTGVYSSPRYLVTYPNGHRVQQVTFCYACAVVGGRLAPGRGEIDALEFYPPGRLPPRPLWYADMLAHALDGRGEPYYDPPERQPVPTPFASLMALRQVVGHATVIWPGASALVRDRAGRVLLLRRADLDVWALPSGALEVGESLAHTAVRETREETGLDVAVIGLLGGFAGFHLTYPNGDQLYPVGTVFACRVVGGALQPDSRETAEVRFFAPDALPPLPDYVAARLLPALAGHSLPL